MKRINFYNLFLFIFISGFIFSCTKLVYNNLWQSRPVNADGNLEEWHLPLRYYDSKSRLQYTITNDSVNLYICMCATDQQTQQKIIHAGMQIWIDTTGTKRQQTGIFYPLAAVQHKKYSFEDDSVKTKSWQFNKHDENSMKDRYAKRPQEMQLVGFKQPIGGITQLHNDYGISAILDWDSTGNMNYEALIPFRTFYKNFIFTSDTNKIFLITIVIPSLSGQPGNSKQREEGGHKYRETGNDEMRENGMGHEGGYGNEGWNGREGHRHGYDEEDNRGNSGSSFSMSQTSTIKIKIRLATVLKSNT